MFLNIIIVYFIGYWLCYFLWRKDIEEWDYSTENTVLPFFTPQFMAYIFALTSWWGIMKWVYWEIKDRIFLYLIKRKVNKILKKHNQKI